MLREPGALIVALLIGLASAVTMLSAYHQLVRVPENERRAQLERPVTAVDLQSAQHVVDANRNCSAKDRQQCQGATTPLPPDSTVTLSKK